MGMTNWELHLHFMRKAEEAEARAKRRLQQIEAAERKVLEQRFRDQSKFWKGRDFELELAHNTSQSRAKDAMWKSHAADNQWFTQKATMYGIAANADMMRDLLLVIGMQAAARIPAQRRGESDG